MLNTGLRLFCAPEHTMFATLVLLSSFLRSTGARPPPPSIWAFKTSKLCPELLGRHFFFSPLLSSLFLSFIPRSSPPAGNLSQQSQLLMLEPHRKIDVSSFYPLLCTNVKPPPKNKKVGENGKGGVRRRKIEIHIPTLNTRHAHSHTHAHKNFSLAPWLLARPIYFVCVRKQEEQKNRIYRLSFPLPNITSLFPSLHP